MLCCNISSLICTISIIQISAFPRVQVPVSKGWGPDLGLTLAHLDTTNLPVPY